MYQQMMQRDDFVIYGYGYDSKTEPDQLEIDNTLARRMAAGNEQAFDLFVYRWRGYVVRYVRNRMDYYSDMADAQEIANDVFLGVVAASRRWIEGYAVVDFVRFFYGFMRIRTTWNLRKITQRKQRAAREREMRAEWHSATIESFDFVGFDDALSDALLKLKSDQRLAFILCDLEGYRQVRAAKIMGVSSLKAHHLLWRARHRLQKLLSDWR